MSAELLAAFKVAAETPGKDENGKDLYVAEILDLIIENKQDFLVGENGADFDKLDLRGGRQEAIAMGLHELKDFFGDFEDFGDLTDALDRQIVVEFAKHEFIVNVRSARSENPAKDLVDVLQEHILVLNDHRQDLIEEWSAVQNNDKVAARVAQLKAENYTLRLEALNARLNDDEFLAALSAQFKLNTGDYPGIVGLTNALDAAGDAVDVVYAINSAIDGTDAITTIKAKATELGLSAGALDKLAQLPDNAGREKAIGLGVNEIRDLFGDYTDPADIKTAVEHQIDVEFAKHQFIKSFEEADTAGEVAEVLLGAGVATLNDHRKGLIDAWDDSNLQAVKNRVAELKGEHYTLALAALEARIADTDGGGFRENLSTIFAEIRRPESYVSIVELIKDLDEAGDTVDARYAFNSADTDLEALQAINRHIEDLLSEDHFAKLEILPNGEGREKAIGLGVNEVRNLFGHFDTVEEITAEVEKQIDVEFAKYELIKAIDDAADVTAMVTALQKVIAVNTDRQKLIEDWSEVENNPAVAARVAQLRSETYTKALKGVADRLGNTEFVAALAQHLLDERTENGGKFYSVIKITNAMAEAVGEINVDPTAPGTKTVTINEDTSSAAVDIEAEDLDGDDLTYTIKDTAKPQKGTVTFDQANGTFTYKPAANMTGIDTFIIVVSDGNGGTAEQTVTVNITAVNDTPWDIALSNAQLAENSKAGTEVGKLTGSDYDGDALTFTLLDNAGGRFTLDAATGVLKVANDYALDFEQAASHTVKVQVKDAAGTTYEESFTIGVTDVAGETVTGTATADVIEGGAGKDVFNGGLGNDKIAGGLGNDTLTGGKGKDTFVFDSKLGTSSTDRKVNFDTIKDFSVKDDSLYLDNAIFKKLGSGTEAKPKQLSKSFFTIGDKAQDKNDYIIYNNKTGVLSYDADGSGKGKAVEFAQLSKNLKLTEKDFFVI